MRKLNIYIKKIAITCLIMSFPFLIFSGCELKSDTPIVGKIVGLKSNEMFKIDQHICSKTEYMIAMLDMANQYKKDFGENLDWQAKVDANTTIEEYVKEKVKEDITVKYALAAMAAKNDIVLSDTEKTDVDSRALDYYGSLTAEEKSYTGATLQDVKGLYTNYLLADKVYSILTENVGDDISEEDARVIKIQYIVMNSSSTNVSKIKSTFKEIKKVVEGGYQDFSREAKQYSNDDTIERTIKKSEASKKYELEAFNLGKGKISNIIQDGNDYYLVYCVDNYMKDKTSENKQDMVELAKEQVFKEQYSKFMEESENDFNNDEWKKIEIYQ
jgi:foldase protein PrsA